MEKQSVEELKECVRCGTCCSNGGPALHDSDLESVKNGVVSPIDLFTIRKGELIRDNINGGLFYTDSELIKVATHAGTARCRLYDPDERACTIYVGRPAQCRAMKCWDTSEIIRLYERNRIGREALFGHITWLWDLIQTHEATCGYGEIRQLAEQRAAGDQAAVDALKRMLAYDDSVRQTLIDKAGMESEMLALLFGRPLVKTLPEQFGVPVKKK